MFDWIRTIITDFMCLTNAITVYDLNLVFSRELE